MMALGPNFSANPDDSTSSLPTMKLEASRNPKPHSRPLHVSFPYLHLYLSFCEQMPVRLGGRSNSPVQYNEIMANPNSRHALSDAVLAPKTPKSRFAGASMQSRHSSLPDPNAAVEWMSNVESGADRMA